MKPSTAYFYILFSLLMAVGTPVYAANPPGFYENRNSGISPTWRNREVTFVMQRGDCQSRTYGDGRGESDCKNGNSRSQLNAKKRQKMGKTYEYAMDIWVDAGFRYNGRGAGSVNYRSRLWIAEWQRQDTIKNHMYEMYLDSIKGATFEDKVCFSPSQFGKWNSFSLRVKWSNGADGFMQIVCNNKVIYSHKGPNVIPPDCGKPWKNQCVTKLQDLRKPILWSVGPSLKGMGMSYAKYGFSSPFPPFPKSGITMKMRNLYVGNIRK